MDNKPIICDPGTGYMKMGFAGDNFPKASFASLVGRPMLRVQESLDETVQLKEIMVGNEASKYRSLLELSHPTSQGIVKNWEDMEILLRYSFQQIGVNNPKNSSVFITEAIMNPVQNKVGMLQLMFEKFQVDRVQYGMQALMSLYAEGMMTAMLLDSGDGVTHCIPVFDGNVISASFERIEIAGRHITDYLLKLLHRRGYAFNSTSDFEIIREIKEKFCFVSGDTAVDNKLALETCVHQKQFSLPDGETIKIGPERFLAPEILMNPIVDGREMDGCGEILFKSINNCDINLRKEFYNNILISGGTSMLPGFPTRLLKEVGTRFRQKILKGAATSSSSIKIRVIDPPTRKYNVFIGASIVASQTANYPEGWKYRKQYQEKGKARLAQELNLKLK